MGSVSTTYNPPVYETRSRKHGGCGRDWGSAISELIVVTFSPLLTYNHIGDFFWYSNLIGGFSLTYSSSKLIWGTEYWTIAGRVQEENNNFLFSLASMVWHSVTFIFQKPRLVQHKTAGEPNHDVHRETSPMDHTLPDILSLLW